METMCSVTADPVPELAREGFIAAAFGAAHATRARVLLSLWMARLADGEQRQPWRFFTLTNGGFYVAPLQLRTLRELYAGNDPLGRLSSDAAGLIATLRTLRQLAREAHEAAAVSAHAKLLEFAREHEEWVAIARAIH